MATERKSGAIASHQGQLGRLAVCAYLAALATALAGCSASEVVQNLTPATAIDLPQPNYRRVVADNVRAVIPNVGSVGDLEISGVRLVDHLKGPAWLTCLKVDAHGNLRIMPCSFKATRLSTRASVSSSINATNRHSSPSTCRHLSPRKRSALDLVSSIYCLRPIAHQNGTPSLKRTSPRPAFSINTRISACVMRCSSRVPKRSSASVRIA